MKLDVIEKMASMNRQKMPKDGAGYSVAITKVDSQKTKNQVIVYVYEEPRNCNFRNTLYWAPVYFDDAKRLYLIYGSKKNGYKVNHNGQRVGSIQYTNENLFKALKAYSDDKTEYFNWKWDNECGRPFIELA